MSLSTLPLSYCTNVHAGRSVAEVEAGLDRVTVPVAREFGGPLAAGLWLAEPVIHELLAVEDGPERFADRLNSRGLTCHTLNAFPYGDFHSERVKEQVYLPDWGDPRRLEYSTACARVLATMLPSGEAGSISTVPLGFKLFTRMPDFEDRASEQLIELARRLGRLRAVADRTIRLGIEPEPMCLLETTPETIAFFSQLRERADAAGCGEAVREHIGVCYDVCHQSVEFEDVRASIEALADAAIRINKVHITCAIQLERPGENPEARGALARYVEPRYLHQTFGRTATGDVLREVDLTGNLALEPDGPFLTADCWRIHFHVPVDAERLGPLETTRGDLRRALSAVARLDYAPHLEVETYTWEVLPDRSRIELVEGLTRELCATRELLNATSAASRPTS